MFVAGQGALPLDLSVIAKARGADPAVLYWNRGILRVWHRKDKRRAIIRNGEYHQPW